MNKTVIGVIIVVAVIGGLIVWGRLAGGELHANLTTRQVAMTCTTDMATEFHIHPVLKIVVNGEAQVVPANIGITAGCMNPLHTHDTSGTLHVESPVQRDFTLGDFFAVYHQPFDSTHILTNTADATHAVTMTVNGTPSDQYENLVLKDGDQIVITYGTPAAE